MVVFVLLMVPVILLSPMGFGSFTSCQSGILGIHFLISLFLQFLIYEVIIVLSLNTHLRPLQTPMCFGEDA